jgi:hypothetical protein
MGDRRVVSPIICKAQHRLALRHRTGAKRRAGAVCGGDLRPSDRSRWGRARVGFRNAIRSLVPAPPGVVILAPPEVPRNAEGGAKLRPRCLTGAG